MMPGGDKVSSAKSAIGKIKNGIGTKGVGMGKRSPVDPVDEMPLRKVRDMMDFNSDSELKPPSPGKGTRSF